MGRAWDEDALPRDRASGVYADASRIHKINHVGPRYRVEGPHLPSPSPQRTPLLFQAGSSPAGRTFAARNAEAQFILSPNPAAARELITETRAIAEHHGRLGSDIKFFQGASLVIGSTEEEARRKERELDAYVSVAGFLAHANLGVSQDDGRPLPEDMLLKDVRTNGGRSHIEWLRKAQPGREPTVGDLGRLVARRHPRLVGTPEQIADQLEVWQQAGVDGLNIVNWMIPSSHREFADHLLPELQSRGLAKHAYAPGPLRQ
jgi:alkanesulfonate monooxygenase SsuD/methylene tetrahydromethanopterin reductase-like flavin-dependent oxidoreductase (luciferase family)